jgi:hypothetical protein
MLNFFMFFILVQQLENGFGYPTVEPGVPTRFIKIQCKQLISVSNAAAYLPTKSGP